MTLGAAGDLLNQAYNPQHYLCTVRAALRVDGAQVGVFEGTLIRGDLMINEGQHLFTVLDDESQELSELAGVLFDPKTNGYARGLDNDVRSYDVLHAEKLAIDDGFRGHRLGLGLFQYVLRYCPHGLAVLTPFPLQCSVHQIVSQAFQAFRDISEKTGVMRLRKLYSLLGFERFKRTEYMIRDNTYRHHEIALGIDEITTRKLVTTARERQGASGA